MKIKIIHDTWRYKKRHIAISNRPKYTIDRDTWLARHGQPLSPMRSERALEERVHTSWQRISGDWTSTTVDTGKSFIFAIVKR